MNKHWFDDPNITNSFPPIYHLYTAYSRLMFNSRSGFVAGGTWLLKKLGKLTRLLHLRNEAMVQIGEVKAWVDLSDPRVFLVFGELAGNDSESEIMRRLLSPGDTFIDAGANHGSYSLKAARLVGEKGKVLALEPQPRLASLIRKSFAANGCSNAEVYEVACSNHSGVTEFYLPERGSGTAGIYKAFSASAAHRKIQVKMARFDELIEWPDLPGQVFVKLDVEGSELAFLRGAEQMIRCRKPFVLLEVNPASAHASGSSAEQLVSFLVSLGYENFSEVESYPRTASLSGADFTNQRNILVIPKTSQSQ